MSKAATAGKLSTLDYILAAVDSGQRHSDFGIVFHLTTAQSLECLRAGARSARNRYPVSGSAIQARHWIPIDVPADGITSIASSAEMMTAAEQFMNCRLDLRREAPIKQLLVTDAQNGKSMLVTHVHHAAADGFSAALWLHHQFRIAAGLEPSVLKSSPFQSVSLRGHSSSVDSHRSEPSQCLWTESTQATGLRRWFTLELPVRQLDMRCLESGVSRSDVLAAAAFETLAKWNRRHGASQRIGLWLPVNIRQRHSSQFGNGTSRIRIHPDSSRTDATFVDRCREIRRLIRCSLRGGDWAVPEYPPYARVPFWFSGPLLNAYLNRPNLDMGTIAFSYVENWNGCEDTVFQDAERIECIGQLHERHALAINAIGGNSTAGSVWVTFTYDPGRLTQDSVRQMADSFRDQILGGIGAKFEGEGIEIH